MAAVLRPTGSRTGFPSWHGPQAEILCSGRDEFLRDTSGVGRIVD